MSKNNRRLLTTRTKMIHWLTIACIVGVALIPIYVQAREGATVIRTPANTMQEKTSKRGTTSSNGRTVLQTSLDSTVSPASLFAETRVQRLTSIIPALKKSLSVNPSILAMSGLSGKKNTPTEKKSSVFRILTSVSDEAYGSGTAVLLRVREDKKICSRVWFDLVMQCKQSYVYDLLTALHVVADVKKITNDTFARKIPTPLIEFLLSDQSGQFIDDDSITEGAYVYKIPCVDHRPRGVSVNQMIAFQRTLSDHRCALDVAWIRLHTTEKIGVPILLPSSEKISQIVIPHNSTCVAGYSKMTAYTFYQKCAKTKTFVLTSQPPHPKKYLTAFRKVSGATALSQILVYPGMSGGAMYNERKELMGILSSSSVPPKSALSIPIHSICSMWPNLCYP